MYIYLIYPYLNKMLCQNLRNFTITANLKHMHILELCNFVNKELNESIVCY